MSACTQWPPFSIVHPAHFAPINPLTDADIRPTPLRLNTVLLATNVCLRQCPKKKTSTALRHHLHYQLELGGGYLECAPHAAHSADGLTDAISRQWLLALCITCPVYQRVNAHPVGAFQGCITAYLTLTRESRVPRACHSLRLGSVISQINHIPNYLRVLVNAIRSLEPNLAFLDS